MIHNMNNKKYHTKIQLKNHRNREKAACPFTLCRGFFTPKIVGTFYMQGYKVKGKTAIVPPVSKLSGHPAKSIPQTHKYMSTHFHSLVQELQ